MPGRAKDALPDQLGCPQIHLQLLLFLLQCRNLDPERFRRIAQLEHDFRATIRKGATVEEMA